MYCVFIDYTVCIVFLFLLCSVYYIFYCTVLYCVCSHIFFTVWQNSHGCPNVDDPVTTLLSEVSRDGLSRHLERWLFSDNEQRSREVKRMGELGDGGWGAGGLAILEFNAATHLELPSTLKGTAPPSSWLAKSGAQIKNWITVFSNTNTYSSTGALPSLFLLLLLGPLHSVIINTVRLQCTYYYNETWQGRRREGSTLRMGKAGRRDRMKRAEL